MAEDVSLRPRLAEPILSDSDEVFNSSEINLELNFMNQKAGRNDVNQFYEMTVSKRGRCLIINNYKFGTLNTRSGSEIDVKNLKRVFTRLRFQVVVKKNVSSNDFVKILEEELAHQDHVNWGMFVFVIMSHGGEGRLIYGADDVAINQHVILRKIFNCRSLNEKPKLIIVQACAGNDMPKCEYDRPTTSGVPTVNLDPHPCTASNENFETELPDDVLILQSASDGFAAIRYKEFGSPFISALVEALYKHSPQHDMETLSRQVQNKIRIFNSRAERQKSERAPLPSYNSYLRKKLHMFPGIISAFIVLVAGVNTGMGYSYCVKWLGDDQLIIGSNFGIAIWNKDLQLMHSYNLGPCEDIALCKQNLIVLHGLSDDSKRITIYTKQMEKVGDIADFPRKSSRLSQIATADDKIVATDDDNKCIYVWSTAGTLLHQINLYDMTHPKGVCITSDGELIVSDYNENGFVRKYQLRGCNLLIWVSTKLTWPWAIAEDSERLLYVCSNNYRNSLVYRLSPDGELLETLTCDELRNTGWTWGISVKGHLLAVACGLEDLKLFKIDC